MRDFFDYLDSIDPVTSVAVLLLLLAVVIYLLISDSRKRGRGRPLPSPFSDLADIHRDANPSTKRFIERIAGAPPAPGDRKWSNFFGSYIELESYEDDDHYFFRVLDHRSPYFGRVLRNQSPWHILPISRP
jgi:hypothetical protein